MGNGEFRHLAEPNKWNRPLDVSSTVICTAAIRLRSEGAIRFQPYSPPTVIGRNAEPKTFGNWIVAARSQEELGEHGSGSWTFCIDSGRDSESDLMKNEA